MKQTNHTTPTLTGGSTRSARIASRTRKGDDGRQRYHGRPRVGRPTHDERDAADAMLAIGELQAAVQLLFAVEREPDTVRAETRRVAHAKIALAGRLVDDVVIRRSP